MHIALRRREVLMSREFLNRSRRRTSHCQMRTERVPQDVHALLDARDAKRLA